MKPLPLAAAILAAALVGWWVFADDPLPSSPVQDDTWTEEDERGVDVPATTGRPPAKEGERAGSAAKDVGPPADAVAPKAEAKAPPALPLADKHIERATWTNESAVLVLQHLSQAAGVGLQLSDRMRQRLERIRVTMERGRTPVPQALDLVLQPHTMSWYVQDGAIVVFDNDD